MKYQQTGVVLKLKYIVAALILSTIASCAPKTVQPISAVPVEVSPTLAYSNVDVTFDQQVKKSESIEESIRNGFTEAIADFRIDDDAPAALRNVDLKVEIDGFRMANAALTFLLGDTSQLAGTVKVLDSETKQELGSYYVDKIISGGGLLGMAMNQSETALAKQFAKEFFKELGKEFISRRSRQRTK